VTKAKDPAYMARFYGHMSSHPDLTSVEMKDYNQQLVSCIPREDSPAFHRGWLDWIDCDAADPNKTHDSTILPSVHCRHHQHNDVHSQQLK